jgi:predicted transcriptional regulator
LNRISGVGRLELGHYRAGKVEETILEILGTSKATEIYQTDLVRLSGYSKSRVSEVLAALEMRGLVSRMPLGRNSRVILRRNFQRGKRVIRKKAEKILNLGMIRASEYPFVLPFEKLLREKTGVRLRFVFYDNGLDLSRDLSQMRLDLGIAPVLTHFVFYSTGSPIKMIAPAGAGGATILGRRSQRGTNKDPGIATTKLSTMELMLRSSIKDGDVPASSKVSYYQGPKPMVRDLLTGEVDAACLWEPYASILLRNPGIKRLARYEDSRDKHLCCAMAAGNHVDSSILYKLSGSFNMALEVFQKNSERYLASYSTMLNYDTKLMRLSLKEYSYPTELDPRKLAKQFERAGIKIPLPATVKDVVLPAG